MPSINSLPWVQFNPLTRLDKIRYFITLPAFSYTPSYTGDSELVTQFNFSADRNFYLRNRPAKPAGVNYLLCIKYRVGDTVYRYKLWSGVGETGMDEVALYSAQLIKKNFVLEVWSVGSTASQADDITIITSVTGLISDINTPVNLALAVGAEFNSYNQIANPVVTLLDKWFSTGSGYSRYLDTGIFGSPPNAWTDQGNAGYGADFSSLGAGALLAAGPDGHNAVINMNMEAPVGPPGLGSFTLFVVCKLSNFVAGATLLKLYYSGGPGYVSIVAGNQVEDGIKLVCQDNVGAIVSSTFIPEFPLDTFTLLEVRCDGTISYLSVGGGAEVATVAQTFTGFDLFRVDYSGNSSLTVTDIILYDKGSNPVGLDEIKRQGVFQYLIQQYPSLGTFLPVSFDSGNSWLDNV